MNDLYPNTFKILPTQRSFSARVRSTPRFQQQTDLDLSSYPISYQLKEGGHVIDLLHDSLPTSVK